jgi:hypothetical protein
MDKKPRLGSDPLEWIRNTTKKYFFYLDASIPSLSFEREAQWCFQQ